MIIIFNYVYILYIGRTRTLVSTWDRKERPPYHDTLPSLPSRNFSDSGPAVNMLPNNVV